MEDARNGERGVWASCGGWLIAAVLVSFVGLAISLVLLEKADVLQRVGGAEIANIGLLAALAGIVALAARDGSLPGWIAAKRNTQPIANALSASAVWLPAGSLVPLFAITYALGFDGLAFLIGPTAGLLIGGVLLQPYLARSGALTTAEFIGLRFGRAARVFAALIVTLLSLLLASAGLAGLAVLLKNTLGISFISAIGIGIAAALICVLPGGMRSETWTGVVFAVVMLAGVLIVAVALMVVETGWGIPQIAYGEVLGRISDLERSILEKDLASADTMNPHLRPYLQIDEPNFFALLFCLAAGTVALPQVLARSFTVASARDARSSAAWTTLFSVLILITIPVYAALAKYNVYKTIDERVPFASLPGWSEDLSRDSGLSIHGVSLGLFEAVTAGVRSGAADVSAIGGHLDARDSDLNLAWTRLEPSVQAAILTAATVAATGGGTDGHWDQFRKKLLPAVAVKSGNETGILTLTALDANGGALALALPQIEGLPYAFSGMLLAAVLAAALAMMCASIMTAASAFGYDLALGLSGGEGSVLPAINILRLSILACLAIVGAFVTLVDATTIIGMAPAVLSIAAATLLPALSLGIWWKRANTWGAIAGMLGGLCLVLYYMSAPIYVPVAFFETWEQLSNADPDYAMEFWSLHETWMDASGAEKGAAWMDLQALASGTLLRPSLANWFGVMPMAAGVLAVPVAFALTILVSLITPWPRPDTQAFIDRLRQPSP